jgi:hypothetical protein
VWQWLLHGKLPLKEKTFFTPPISSIYSEVPSSEEFETNLFWGLENKKQLWFGESWDTLPKYLGERQPQEEVVGMEGPTDVGSLRTLSHWKFSEGHSGQCLHPPRWEANPIAWELFVGTEHWVQGWLVLGLCMLTPDYGCFPLGGIKKSEHRS